MQMFAIDSSALVAISLKIKVGAKMFSNFYVIYIKEKQQINLRLFIFSNKSVRRELTRNATL
jgi:hypothetical protein